MRISMKLQIDKSKKLPLYQQIVEQIRAQITSGEIPEGYQFPSERQLAEALGVNRTTVLNAYKELKADGLMAVSYTHLDVYKRQRGKWRRGNRNRNEDSL